MKLAVVGVDEEFGMRLAGDLERAGARVATVGRDGAAAYRLESACREADGGVVRARARGEPVTWRTGLAGEHNALNGLMALALGDALEIPRDTTLGVLAQARAPAGRLERIDEGQPFAAIVDYAHNPGGIEAILGLARDLAAGGAVRVVLGALWVLTTEQREAMGAVAAEGCDDLVLTTDRAASDEPADEAAPGLLDGARGVAAGRCEFVPDRAEAIARAVGRAEPGDLVLVLGRGPRATLPMPDGTIAHVSDGDLLRRALRDRCG